ncbi:flagellin N-terminal helical domain-containing protein [Massilia rhizosphaerae]|uniref:flagellin N-terminal helical domain-containing protein n=1 Tax=Massilia rhizosphaerae TaxID=2784389 RepID=UPI0018DC5253|nr:flagellin [Massilia rhizosphaerae]
MLSLHTNPASLSAQNSLGHTQTALSTSMTRLSTGYRINSAADDAAGLQIATRLKSQTSGMAVAMRNTQNSISMLQTADGALNEVNNVLTRMKDLATQAADGSSSANDKTAMQAEYDSLTDELSNIFSNTKFGGTRLLNMNDPADANPAKAALAGKLNGTVKFQIGADSSETMSATFATELGDVKTAIRSATGGDPAVAGRFAGDSSATVATIGHALADRTGDANAANNGTADATAAIQGVSDAIDAVSALRSKLGAISNRLDHVYNNLANISSNTQAATGRIMDVDFATESSSMTSNQMLMQAGTAMLKQTNGMSSMVMSLLQ